MAEGGPDGSFVLDTLPSKGSVVSFEQVSVAYNLDGNYTASCRIGSPDGGSSTMPDDGTQSVAFNDIALGILENGRSGRGGE